MQPLLAWKIDMRDREKCEWLDMLESYKHAPCDTRLHLENFSILPCLSRRVEGPSDIGSQGYDALFSTMSKAREQSYLPHIYVICKTK